MTDSSYRYSVAFTIAIISVSIALHNDTGIMQRCAAGCWMDVFFTVLLIVCTVIRVPRHHAYVRSCVLRKISRCRMSSATDVKTQNPKKPATTTPRHHRREIVHLDERKFGKEFFRYLFVHKIRYRVVILVVPPLVFVLPVWQVMRDGCACHQQR